MWHHVRAIHFNLDFTSYILQHLLGLSKKYKLNDSEIINFNHNLVDLKSIMLNYYIKYRVVIQSKSHVQIFSHLYNFSVHLFNRLQAVNILNSHFFNYVLFQRPLYRLYWYYFREYIIYSLVLIYILLSLEQINLHCMV